MGAIIYVSIGSNIENRFDHLQQAVYKLREQVGEIVSISSIYITPPWGFEANLDFYNACLCVRTSLEPIKVIHKFQEIEFHLGRVKNGNENYESRTIDIDLLTYNNLSINREDLIIPHPRMKRRLFVLLPLREIAPNFKYPNTRKSIQMLIDDCEDSSKIEILPSKLSHSE